MIDKFFAEELYEKGFTDLVPVIPPGAQLVPSSTISQASLGKVPGRRTANGLWAGVNWRALTATIDDARQWSIEGANIGLRGEHFPAVDIDCMDPRIAQIIEDAALATLGPAPVRTGRAPKRLLVYRTTEPFSRMRLWIKRAGGEQHLVEVLGAGQQYLVAGVHPSGRPYSWDRGLPNAGELTEITRGSVDAFLGELARSLDMLGLGVIEREGDGSRVASAPAADQTGLQAPTLAALREAVALIPNNDVLFPQRDDYIRMGYAIRAAGAADPDEAYQIFADWADRHEGDDGRVGGNPDTWLSDWRRIKGPFVVGWSYLAEQARGFGFNDAALEFDVVDSAPQEAAIAAPRYSDQWLADRVVARLAGVLRHVPQTGKYLVWSGSRWLQDGDLIAEDLIKRELRVIADQVLREGATPKEQKESLELAQRICSAGKATAVAQFIRSDRSIAVSMSALDHDPWVLNTPGGLVDLKSGKLGSPDPDALCTRSTSVPPDFSGAAPEWRRFLAEATGGDVDLELYLQRLAGYALTGSTREQNLAFIHGGGGNGKGVFINTITGILSDYARIADMSTFTASNTEKHSTDVAMMVGARLVTASETQQGKRWDEQKVKALTGGDPVTARFMRQDNFTFIPQFKLLFTGNHKPEARSVDRAMKRRIQMIPFTVEPAKPDLELMSKLRDEWPAILAWMIEGCIAWQGIGLCPPEIVQASTAQYFKDEDAVGRWLGESTERDDTAAVTIQELFASWRTWAGENGEYPGSLKRLSAELQKRGFGKWQDPTTRRAGYRGVTILAPSYAL